MKYKNYGDLIPEEQEKYAPKETRYTSRKNIKKEYGVAVRSEKGKPLYASTRANWVAVLQNRDTCEQNEL